MRKQLFLLAPRRWGRFARRNCKCILRRYQQKQSTYQIGLLWFQVMTMWKGWVGELMALDRSVLAVLALLWKVKNKILGHNLTLLWLIPTTKLPFWSKRLNVLGCYNSLLIDFTVFPSHLKVLTISQLTESFRQNTWKSATVPLLFYKLFSHSKFMG